MEEILEQLDLPAWRRSWFLRWWRAALDHCRFHFEKVVRRGLEQGHCLGDVLIAAIEPTGKILRRDDGRASWVNGGDECVGIGGDDRRRLKFRAIPAHPMFPDSGKSDQAMIGTVDEIGFLLAGDIALPFIEAVGGDEAAPPPESIAEGRLFVNAFTPRINQGFSGQDFLGPGRHETPAHQSEMPRTIIALPHDGDGASRRHILARREIRLFHVVEKGEGLFRRSSETVKSTHGARD